MVAKASEATPIPEKDSNSARHQSDSKKRKKSNSESLMNTHVPKKRVASVGSNASSITTLTLSQREEQAMKELSHYVEECGGVFAYISLLRRCILSTYMKLS